MSLEKEKRFRIVVDCDVEVEDGDMSVVLAKLGRHLKDAKYVTRVNTVDVQSYEAINEFRRED